MSKFLFEDSDDETNAGLKINKSYAEHYDQFRSREEAQKLKDRYGDAVLDDSDAEDEEDEDDDAMEDTEAMEKGFLRALAVLKSGSEARYDNTSVFYNEANKQEEEPSTSKKKPMKEKPLHLQDYERKLVLEKKGVLSDEESDEEEANMRAASPTFVQEEDEIRQSFKQAVEEAASDEEEDSLLTRRLKTAGELKEAERSYVEWLKGMNVELNEDEEQQLHSLKEYWTDPNLDDSEKFLRDYILNRRYRSEDADRAASSSLPTYEEIVGQRDRDGEEDVELEEMELEREEDFERKYNFRYQEPDREFIKSFPRTIGESLRRETSKRKDHRDAYKARKTEEKRAKIEGLKQLKRTKEREIMRKVEKLKAATGDESIKFDLDELDRDFDPAEYDRKMAEAFAKYDQAPDEDGEKPVFTDSEPEEDWDNYTPIEPHHVTTHHAGSGSVKEEPLDPDIPGPSSRSITQARIQTELSGGRKRRKKQSKLHEALQQPKPTFDPAEKTFEEYLREYYALDYEDIVAGDPVRFRYRKVEPNDFGLSVDEVLAADDKELNAWVSVKKMSQYRSQQEEMADKRVFSKKGLNDQLKMKKLPSVFGAAKPEHPDEEIEQAVAAVGSAVPTKVKEKSQDQKIERKVKVEDECNANIKVKPEPLSVEKPAQTKYGQGTSKKARRNANKRAREGPQTAGDAPRPKRRKVKAAVASGMTDSRLKAYGVKK